MLRHNSASDQGKCTLLKLTVIGDDATVTEALSKPAVIGDDGTDAMVTVAPSLNTVSAHLSALSDSCHNPG